MINEKRVDNCIACDSDKLSLIFDLGYQPLANSYKYHVNEEEMVYPLGINFCNRCGHIQLTHIVDPKRLFVNYPYMSGVSKTVLEFFEWFSEMSISQFKDYVPLSVLDIGCNDGSQLDFYKNLGLETYGVDPAINLAVETSKRHKIQADFYREGMFGRTFDIITVQNAFAHNNEQLELLKNVKSSMHDKTKLFIVTSQKDMFLNGEFDTIYHEHISFYNIKSMYSICKRAGLNLIDVITHSVHGNSYIFVISLTESNEDHIKTLIKEEELSGLYSFDLAKKFKQKAEYAAKHLKDFVESAHKNNVPVVGYSAPAKAMTFLNYCKAKPDFIIDDTPTKQNKFTPGLSIPIYSKDKLDELSDIDSVCFVIFAWNFYDEIKNKILKERSDKNDIFVKYFPNFHIEDSQGINKDIGDKLWQTQQLQTQ